MLVSFWLAFGVWFHLHFVVSINCLCESVLILDNNGFIKSLWHKFGHAVEHPFLVGKNYEL